MQINIDRYTLASETRKTERGELMLDFIKKLGTDLNGKLYTMPRMGRLLKGIPTSDLYFLQKESDSKVGMQYKDKMGKERYLKWGQIFFQCLKFRKQALDNK